MAELDNNKAGPQEPTSSVFKGVPHPQNSSARKPFGTPKADHETGGSTKPASTGGQISRNSLISKLSQSEFSTDKVEQNQSANVFPKSMSKKQTTQNSLINKLPQPRESLERSEPTIHYEERSFLETTDGNLWQQIKGKLFTPKPGVSPTRQRAMVIMIPILAIIMIFAFRQVLSKAPSQTEGAGTDDVPLVAHIDTGHEIDWKIPEPITVISRDPIKLPDEGDKQNPQQPEQNETTGQINTETIIVRDIVFSKDKPSAVIGSKIVYVGDVINGVTILKIGQDTVEFEKDGQRWEQNVREGTKNLILEVTEQSEGRSEPLE